MPITLKIKKQGGGMEMHIGDPDDKRGHFRQRHEPKPDKPIKIEPKKGKKK